MVAHFTILFALIVFGKFVRTPQVLCEERWNEMETALPIFKVSRLVRVHTDSHHNDHNKMIFAVSYV